jgi:hypothetical protein
MSMPVAITVLPNGGFSLVGTPAFATVPVGGSGNTGVKAIRVGGLTAPISYTVTGLPSGLTATVSATSVADSVSVAFTASQAIAQGTYNVTVSGTANGKTQTVSIAVTVGPSTVATVQLDLSACVAGGRTVWLAAQDGAQAWRRITESNGLYTFQLTSGRAAVAAAINSASETEVFVNFGTPAELMARDYCDLPSLAPRTRTLTVSATGIGSNEFVDVTTGGFHTSLQTALPSFNLTNLPNGPLDMVAWKYNRLVAGQGIRGIIRRNQLLGNGATAAPFEFTAASMEWFLPATASVTSGGFGSESGSAGMSYYVGQGCRQVYDLGNSLPFTNTLYGVPFSAMQGGELHGLYLATNTRLAINYFAAVTNQSISLGAAPPGLSVTTLGGSYRRQQIVLTLPADYTYAVYEYSDGSSRWASVAGNTGYFGGAAMTLVMPDLSAVEGFNTAWVPANGTSGRWNFNAASHVKRPCVDGAKYVEARLTGIN